jgi:hypothetical protein
MDKKNILLSSRQSTSGSQHNPDKLNINQFITEIGSNR